MFNGRDSDELELPEFPSDKNYPKPSEKENNNEKVSRNKKVVILIIVILGVVVLGVIIFLIIYFSTKKKEDGGFIFVSHQIDENSPDSFTIINIDNLEDNDYTIEDDTKSDNLIQTRDLEETNEIYSIDKNIFKFNVGDKGEGRLTFKIKFNKVLTTMSGMFKKLTTVISIDLSNFKSEKVKYMDSAFLDCTSLEYINFENFNSKVVENMDNCFENCRELTEVDLSSFETPKLKSMKSAFKNCENLSFLELNNFIFNNVDISNIFENDQKLHSNSLNIDDQKTRDLLNTAVNLGNNNTNENNPYIDCETGTDDKCKSCRSEEGQTYKCFTCNEGYYLPKNVNNPTKCKKCFRTCKECTDYMNCYSCIDNYVLNEDKKCIIKTKDKDTDITPEISDDVTEITTEKTQPYEPDITDNISDQIETDEQSTDDEYSYESVSDLNR